MVASDRPERSSWLAPHDQRDCDYAGRALDVLRLPQSTQPAVPDGQLHIVTPSFRWRVVRWLSALFDFANNSSARAKVSISLTGLSGRTRTILGKRNANPLSWRRDRC